MKFKGYIFDMDGTLIDNGRYHILAWQEFAKRHGKTVDGQDILDWMGMTGDVYNERILGRKLTPEEQRELGEEKESLYRDIYRPHMRLPEGLLNFLKGIRASGGKCALATGGPQANADFILDGLKIREHFSAVVSAGLYQRSKPDPECFLLAASMIGVAPRDCVVFEDGLPGIKAGKAAGMKVIGVTFTHPRDRLLDVGADCVITGYVGVDGIVNSLN